MLENLGILTLQSNKLELKRRNIKTRDIRTRVVVMNASCVMVVLKRTAVGNLNSNSSFQNYSQPDDHTIRTTDTPGFNRTI